MLDLLKQLVNSGAEPDFKQLVGEGATIIDVRTAGEYQGGHLDGAVNIPLNQLKNKLHKINKNFPVILCCASGARSRSAHRILESNGFDDVYDGGGWMRLQGKLN